MSTSRLALMRMMAALRSEIRVRSASTSGFGRLRVVKDVGIFPIVGIGRVAGSSVDTKKAYIVESGGVTHGKIGGPGSFCCRSDEPGLFPPFERAAFSPTSSTPSAARG